LKLVFDANISGHAVRKLREDGHDVLWAADMSGDMSDRELLDISIQRQSVLVTADAHFGNDFLKENEPHPAIVRLVGIPPTLQGESLKILMDLHSDMLVPGAIVTGGKNAE